MRFRVEEAALVVASAFVLDDAIVDVVERRLCLSMFVTKKMSRSSFVIMTNSISNTSRNASEDLNATV